MEKVIKFILGGYYKVVPIAVVYFAIAMALFTVDPYNQTGVYYLAIGFLILSLISIAFTVLFVRKR